MAKNKDTTTSAAKMKQKLGLLQILQQLENLVRLLNILALLLAITAFLLQFFAVITHHWKYQVTSLNPILASDGRSRASPYEDSRIDQSYGLYSRKVKVYANNDEQLDVCASTRFPRLDNGEDDLNDCLRGTSTLRGALLTCSARLRSPNVCHCRRYYHWSAIIFFEITALILLGLVVVLVSLLTTQYQQLLKLAGLALSFLAFLFLLMGLIVLLGYLKRETRSISDDYPHINSRWATQVGQRYSNAVHKVVRRQVHEQYRAYPLKPGQHVYNETHYQEYSEPAGTWVHRPYSTLEAAGPYAPRAQQSDRRTMTEAPRSSRYGPALGYNTVYENTHAWIGWSAVLSILALILSLLLAGLLAFSWITGKKLGAQNSTTTTTTTIVKTEYPLPAHDVTHETVPLTSRVPTEIVRQGPPYDTHGVREEHTTITPQAHRA